jgi:hypothetical protein
MPSTIPRELADLLSSHTLRVATGLWLLPLADLPRLDNAAVRLGFEAVDLRQQLIASLPTGTRYAGLSAARLLELVDAVANRRADYAGALVYQLDLLLARLTTDERAQVWQELYAGLPHRTRGVLFVMPETAANLLPAADALDAWRRARRLFGSLVV